LRTCEEAARAAGFKRLVLVATKTGEPFFARRGYRRVAELAIALPGHPDLPTTRMEEGVFEEPPP
jgi:hypothetical protein